MGTPGNRNAENRHEEGAMKRGEDAPCLKPDRTLVARPRLGAWCSWADGVIIGETRCGHPVEENMSQIAHGHGAAVHLSENREE